MKLSEVIARLMELQENTLQDPEVLVYFQNTQQARDFDDVGFVGDGKGGLSIWLSDLGE